MAGETGADFRWIDWNYSIKLPGKLYAKQRINAINTLEDDFDEFLSASEFDGWIHYYFHRKSPVWTHRSELFNVLIQDDTRPAHNVKSINLSIRNRFISQSDIWPELSFIHESLRFMLINFVLHAVPIIKTSSLRKYSLFICQSQTYPSVSYIYLSSVLHSPHLAFSLTGKSCERVAFVMIITNFVQMRCVSIQKIRFRVVRLSHLFIAILMWILNP